MSTEEQIQGKLSLDSISEYYDKNKNNVMIAGIALIVIAAGIYYYNSIYKPELELEAGNSLFMAERYYGSDSLTKALNGDGVNLGVIDIADEFGGTKAGNTATYLAGRILLDQGKFEEALDYLNDADLDDQLLSTQAIILKGDCYSELEQFEKAGDKYMKAANANKNIMTTPYALSKAGLAYEEAGEYSDALEAYERLRIDYSTFRVADKVDARIARVTAKKAAK
ncbi:MAG: tetratricopeptide repeat protein [Bacteroidia bacterium]|jgi:tetratricopeptide (TPR) repeat protein|tara:strand:+ start:961 stop:1635 length:675 start_codon:yes stop_codon:yes gene_type:complete